MKKILTILCSAMLVFATVGRAGALMITLETKSFYEYPDVKQFTVGTFVSDYDFTGQVITSASISGQWGITSDDDPPFYLYNNSTAGNEIFWGNLDLKIASTGDTSEPSPWEYVFTDFSVFSKLNDGIDLIAVQTSSGVVHLDETTLTVETAPIPEPATMLLLGTGLVGLAGFGRKKFSKKMRSS